MNISALNIFKIMHFWHGARNTNVTLTNLRSSVHAANKNIAVLRLAMKSTYLFNYSTYIKYAITQKRKSVFID